ncbi:hypothetical protein [Nocardia stercoris]|uniref:Uncharacterized protein n=1 Tax=Nocardia stercoris TaxID=2483361 RepID=A0A3M2KWC1_9NOCA|nr:hypothetical protein [Nocardia stercoris]RMI29521.1 hypothetical protein EBN03_25980 [Nocardia stercoris]
MSVPGPVPPGPLDLADYVGRPVLLLGVADNLLAGAILVCGRNSHVYIDGLDRWPEEQCNRPFEVTGVLAERDSDADLRGPDGRPRQGIGRHYVVRDATWTPLH